LGRVNEAAGDPTLRLPDDLLLPANPRTVRTYCNHEAMTKRRHLPAALALAALALTGLAGCGGSSGGSSTGGDYGGRHPDYRAALAGSPPPLARLHRQADDLLGGGAAAYEARIAALRGYPTVTNVWASWCGPCRLEFPILQRLSARYGKRVAFLGINSQDGGDTASTFLREAPVPYPSYTDPSGSLADTLGTTVGLPDTAFYDRSGELVFLKQGPYSSESELEEDLRHYALKGG
jgi:cytochrome c biogenesis protein CcmG, thiol:disulfide interchange protein DsbE